jgi:capsular polysaccharide export protein
VSKYNHARESAPEMGAGARVLVVDQTAGDASIAAGGATAASFRTMLEAALDEHPHASIVLKSHPDVIAGRKRGHFERLSPGQAQRVQVIGYDLHPPALLEHCDAVYVVGSLMGFEALLWQRPVRCFGMPFYAGWGLTRDHLSAPLRRQALSLEALVHAALIDYARYVDPETGAACSAERAVAHLALQRRTRARFAPELHAVGFSRWKKPIARAFFDGSTLQFLHQAPRAAPQRPVVVWGRKPAPAGCAVVRVEDGFLRSVGLGADLTRPLSWVLDDLGIYFDATQPSRLEAMLERGRFDHALLERARRLREAIVAAGITKYNVGTDAWTPARHGRAVVLVPGQVESDASIALGAADIHTNLGLLRAARAARPQAHLVYKPHPDVVAGLRGRSAQTRQAIALCRAQCDEIVVDTPMGRLLDQVDEVHTLTSLAGFEALLRAKPVVTWGLPFYAGWGLTEDRAPASSPALLRRTRRLTLDELVAATLILYPTYVSRCSGVFTTPERALQELVAWQSAGSRDRASGPLRMARRWLLTLAARARGL